MGGVGDETQRLSGDGGLLFIGQRAVGIGVGAVAVRSVAVGEGNGDGAVVAADGRDGGAGEDDGAGGLIIAAADTSHAISDIVNGQRAPALDGERVALADGDALRGVEGDVVVEGERHVALYGDAVADGGVLADGDVAGPRRKFPLGVEHEVAGEGDADQVVVLCARAVLAGVPSVEVVVLRSIEAAGGERLSAVQVLGVHCARAAVGVVGHLIDWRAAQHGTLVRADGLAPSAAGRLRRAAAVEQAGCLAAPALVGGDGCALRIAGDGGRDVVVAVHRIVAAIDDDAGVRQF